MSKTVGGAKRIAVEVWLAIMMAMHSIVFSSAGRKYTSDPQDKRGSFSGIPGTSRRTTSTALVLVISPFSLNLRMGPA